MTKQGTAKIAISLPQPLLDRLEDMRRETGETRSALVQRLVREKLAEQERSARVRRYVEGYRAAPESPEEVTAAESAAAVLLAEEPWE